MNNYHYFLYLNRSWPESKEFISSTLGITIHIYKDVYTILMDAISCFSIAWNLWNKKIRTHTMYNLRLIQLVLMALNRIQIPRCKSGNNTNYINAG